VGDEEHAEVLAEPLKIQLVAVTVVAEVGDMLPAAKFPIGG